VKYDFESVAVCDDVEKVIPRLLFALAVIFCLVFVISVVSAILALLVLRAERNKRGYIGVSDKFFVIDRNYFKAFDIGLFK